MIWFLIAGAALAVLFAAPAVPEAARAAAAQRDRARQRRAEDQQRREQEARERIRQAQQIWLDAPDLAGFREYEQYEAQVRTPLQQASDEAARQFGQVDQAVGRHQARFHDGEPPRAGYQLIVLVGLAAFVAVFILGITLDYLIFRGLHPTGAVALPFGLACVAMIGITVGSVLLFGAKRHHLVPESATPYFRRMAILFGGMLAVGIAGYMAFIAPNRSYMNLEPAIVTDQEALTAAQHSVPAAPPGVVQADATQLADDQARLNRAEDVDRASALALGAIEIPLAEVAVLAGVVVIFRILLVRRERARRAQQDTADAVAQADARFIAALTAQLVGNGHDEQEIQQTLARVRRLGKMLADHADPGAAAPGPGPGPAPGPMPGPTPVPGSGPMPGQPPGPNGGTRPNGSSPGGTTAPDPGSPWVSPANGTPTTPGPPGITQPTATTITATAPSASAPSPAGVAGAVTRLPAAELDETALPSTSSGADQMSTRVTQSIRISAACRELVNERLNVRLGQTTDLGQVSAALNTGRVDLAGLQTLIGDAELSGVLGRLAPGPFGRARAALTGTGHTINPSAQVMSARTEMAEAVSTASSAIAGATRDLTVEAFTAAATELGYMHSAWRGEHATGLELWRDNELMLLRIREDGMVESDHAGLADGSCGDRQLELEARVALRGLEFSDRKQYNHGAYDGGHLINAALARGDSSLARAVVADYEQQVPIPGSRLFGTADAEPSHRTREMRRGGAS
jgi:hypothetical protein